MPSKRIQESQKRREEFLARFATIKQHIAMTEEEFFTWENGDEEYVVPLIKKYLRTPEQVMFLYGADLTIEDCLNGRVAGDLTRKIVQLIFDDWNKKLGTKHFGGF